MQHHQQITAAPIAQLIISKSAPMLVGVFAILLFNLVDSYFIAKLGTEALAALSFTLPVSFLFTSLATGIGNGLAANLGRLLGARQQHVASQLTRHSLLFSVLVCVGLSALGTALIHPMFLYLGAELSVISYIERYMTIWYWAIPMLVCAMVASAALRASGDSWRPCLLMLIAGGVNGVLDPILIFGVGPIPAMGIEGAAIASTIAWLLTFVASIYLLQNKSALLSAGGRAVFSGIRTSWRSLLSIAVPATLSQLFAPLANTLALAMLAKLGTATVAAYGLATRIEALLLIGIMALNSVVPMLVGQNIGARQPQRAREVVHKVIRMGLLWQLLLACLIYPIAPMLSRWISSDPLVMELTSFYLRLLPFCYPMIALVLILVQALNAMAKPIYAMLLNAARLLLIFVPAIYLSVDSFNPKLVFVAMTAAHTLAGLLSGLLLVLMMKKRRWWAL
ncbi:MATE family efflux transporter [Aliagarivorans taiwanensis]|uniref:MATE family efflux transporter n=1 Tax=Aliagarivorans taiwanensis TaxID=561966 RepID=UPI00040EBC69|nr:MATE family efflux transporter [Aliagarivorans taiwanensis]